MIDNDKMWASIISCLEEQGNYILLWAIRSALKDQGLQYNPETRQIEKMEEKPLTEFEKTFKKLLECYASAMGTPVIEQPIESTMGFIKKHGSSLLDIARNEVIKDMDNMTRYGVMAINQTSFNLGYGKHVDEACAAYCKVCDTKECGGTGECCWITKFKQALEEEKSSVGGSSD